MAHYSYDFLWRDIKFLIVDEGDKLLESGFQKDFDYIRENISGRVQVGFFLRYHFQRCRNDDAGAIPGHEDRQAQS